MPCSSVVGAISCDMQPQAERQGRDGTGFLFSPELREFVATPRYIALSARSEMQLMQRYGEELRNWDTRYVDVLSRCCYQGDLDGVKKLVQTHPKLNPVRSEAGLSFGYLYQVIVGYAVEFIGCVPEVVHVNVKRKELVQYLCDLGCQVDHTDIMGYTAFFYALMNGEPKGPNTELAKVLLENGANVNHQNKFGSTALMEAISNNKPECVQFLLDHGADMNLCNANGISAQRLSGGCRPNTFATISNWKQNRLGIELPLQTKACAVCKKAEKNMEGRLRSCSRCRLVQYCSKECQRIGWREHKETCLESLEQKVVILKPYYSHVPALTGNHKKQIGIKLDLQWTLGSEDFCIIPRDVFHAEFNPSATTTTTNMILRVQTNFQFDQPHCMLVHDRRKRFMCKVRAQDNPEGYAELAMFIADKGFPPSTGGPGVIAYLLADLKNPDELVFNNECCTVGNTMSPFPFSMLQMAVL